MKELIIRLPGVMALAITLVLTGSGPLCAQRAPGAPLSSYDRIYQQSLVSMQNQARRVGLTIDTDIDVLVGASSHVLLATIDGFENIRLDENGPNEFDFGFVNLTGFESIPDGYYRMHYVVDFRFPEQAVVLLINSLGQVFTYPIEMIDETHPERGARKGLTSEGGTAACGCHMRMGDGSVRFVSINIS